MNNTIKKKYDDNFKVRRYVTDFYEYLSPMGIIGFMEVLATDHAKALNCYDSLEQGYYWILRSSKYEMLRMPKNDEIVHVITWPSGLDRLKSLRRFEFYVGDELVGKAYQYWLSVSYQKNKPVISDHYKKIIDNLDLKEEDYFKLKKVTSQKDLKHNYTKLVLPRDIDTHQHMNNVRYIDVIYNAIDIELLKKYQIIKLQIDYIKEAKVQAEMKVYTKQIDHIIYVEGRINDSCSFRAKLELKPLLN